MSDDLLVKTLNLLAITYKANSTEEKNQAELELKLSEIDFLPHFVRTMKALELTNIDSNNLTTNLRQP